MISDRQLTDEALNPLSPEARAIVDGLLGKPAPQNDLDCMTLARLALAHDVAAVLHQEWHTLPGSLPVWVVAEFAKIREENALSGAKVLDQRNDVVHILTDAGVDFLLLKGAALARRWY